MSLLGYALLLTTALCCTAAPTSDGLCPRPERLVEAELQGDWENDSYPKNTEAAYHCRPGYSRYGSIKMICLNGKWEFIHPKGQCRKKSCGHPGDIQFGSFHLKNEESFVFGAVVHYFCDEGYRMVSRETTRQCTASGWSNYPPHCEVRNCPPVEAANNINILSTSYDEEYSVGQVVRFECKDPNHKLKGPSEIFCTSEGEWNLEPPTCEEISCELPLVEHGKVNNPKKNSYKNNEVIQITCDEGFRAIKNGESKCTKDDWNPKPSCDEIVCSPYHPVEKGKMVATKTVYKYGDEIDVECESGYVLQMEPNKRRTCTSNDWYPPSRCVSKKCDRPYIYQGYFDRSYYFPMEKNRYVYYYCEDNFLTPDKNNWAYIYCTETGWNPEPQCLRKCLRSEVNLENASLLNRQSVYLEGEKVKFQCNRNFKTSDGKTDGEITCLSNGKFTPAKCSITCKAPQLRNGKLNTNKKEFETGEYLQYECNTGYITKNRYLIGGAHCDSGRWSEVPSCTPITCEHEGNSYKDGDIIKYTCPLGKRPTSETGQCYYYGWGPPYDCQDIQCTIPDTSDLIPSPHKLSYKINTEVSFSCKEGFGRVGPLDSMCTKEGWNPSLPTCQKIICTISEKANLIRNPLQHTYKENDQVLLKCEDGFIQEGANTTICTNNGWNPPLPTCEEEKPAQPGTTDPSPDDNEKQVENPLEPDSVAPPPDSNDKKDEPDSVVLPENPEDNKEKRQKCPPAYNPNNAEILDEKEAYYSNDNVTMKCARGFKMHGSSVVRCIDGKWEQPPQCIRVTQCKNPPTIQNGGIIESSKQQNYVTDDIVTYSCKLGFHFSGSNQITCVNGQWSELPVCTEDSCDEAPEVTHATVIEKKKTFSHGEKAKYICDNGFRFSREDSASCIEGKWFSIPTCAPTSCDAPPTVPNTKIKGRVKASYASGEKVTYLCNSGFSLERSFNGEAICENTHWNNLPVCRRIGEQCGPPPTVQFGDTVEYKKANYKSGESVEYKCPSFHILKGNRIVRCLNGVWDEAPVCLEPCTVKEKDMEANNIQLKWTYERKLYSTHGDNMTFTCKPGFVAPPDTQMRITCQQGKLEYPKCFKRGFCVLQQTIMINNNIHYNISTIVDQGQKVKFQCNEGTIPENELEVKCDSGNINYPKCSATKSCKTPEIPNGFLTTEQQASYNSGTNVEFKCNKDYVISTPIKVKCENGQWTDLPVCYSPCKIFLEDLAKHDIQLLSSSDPQDILDRNHEHGTEIGVTCKSGFRRPNQAALVTECNDGKFRYPRCFSGKTCRIDQDGLDKNNLELDEVHDNEVYYEEGEKIQFNCKNGFYHQGKPTGTCSEQKLIYPECKAESAV